jgi:hypothetical protein
LGGAPHSLTYRQRISPLAVYFLTYSNAFPPLSYEKRALNWLCSSGLVSEYCHCAPIPRVALMIKYGDTMVTTQFINKRLTKFGLR